MKRIVLAVLSGLLVVGSGSVRAEEPEVYVSAMAAWENVLQHRDGVIRRGKVEFDVKKLSVPWKFLVYWQNMRVVKAGKFPHTATRGVHYYSFTLEPLPDNKLNLPKVVQFIQYLDNSLVGRTVEGLPVYCVGETFQIWVDGRLDYQSSSGPAPVIQEYNSKYDPLEDDILLELLTPIF